jgi:hypothetical protein
VVKRLITTVLMASTDYVINEVANEALMSAKRTGPFKSLAFYGRP